MGNAAPAFIVGLKRKMNKSGVSVSTRIDELPGHCQPYLIMFLKHHIVAATTKIPALVSGQVQIIFDPGTASMRTCIWCKNNKWEMR